VKNFGKKIGFTAFMHPYLCLDYASYLSPPLAVEINKWVHRFISGDATLLHDVANRIDEVHGTKSILTVTRVDKEKSDRELAELHQKVATSQTEILLTQAQLKEALREKEELMKSKAAMTEDLETTLGRLNLSQRAAMEYRQADAKKQAELQELEKSKAEMTEDLETTLARLNLSEQAAMEYKLADAKKQAKLQKFLQMTVDQDARIEELQAKLAAANANVDSDLTKLTVEVRIKRRKLNAMQKIERKNADQNEEMVQRHLFQVNTSYESEDTEEDVEGPSEQRGCNSMPARFIALKGVNEATNGKDHKIVHALVKETLGAIGENLMKYKRCMGLSKTQLMEAIATIMNDYAQDQRSNPMSSNVFITNMLCGNIKRVLELEYATYMSLGQLYGFVRRSNRFFEQSKMSPEFQLVQQGDLEKLLGYEAGHMPKLARYSPLDMRNFFKALEQ